MRPQSFLGGATLRDEVPGIPVHGGRVIRRTDHIRDYGGDFDTWSVTAFNGAGGTGTNLGNTSDFSLGDPPQTATLNRAGMLSVLVIGGSTDFPNSLYYDNVIVDTASNVPEPGTLLMIPSGLAMLVLVRRRVAGTKPLRSQHYPAA